MKAFEARKASIEPQYEAAMKDIEQAIGWGWKSAHVCRGHSLYPEVAKRIAEEGYDVKIILRADDDMSYNVISWGSAEKGKKGTLNYVDETKLKTPSSSKFMTGAFRLRVFPSFKEDEENFQEKDEKNETENDSEAHN